MTKDLEQAVPHNEDSTEEVPTGIDFATDVKSDRLEILWQVTLGVSIAATLLMFTFVTAEALSPNVWIYMPVTMAFFCVMTRFLLKAEHYDTAALVYTVGGIAAVTAGLTDTTNTVSVQVIPFMYIVIIFMGGLLLRPSTSIGLAALAGVLTVVVPSLIHGFDVIGVYQIVAVTLTFVGALMAAQVTGELYQVTEWALSNYERERSSNKELFENRNVLRRSLLRSEVLGEQLRDSNQKLEEAKTAAEAAKNFRGQFLANMSHELRTPLNAIIGFSETMLKFPMMYDDEELPEAYRADLNQIHTSGQQLLSLINDILDLARVDAGKLEIHMEPVALRPVIDNVIATANGLIAGKPIKLTFDMADPLPDVWADQNRVRQVLLNLYSNAAKFTDAGTIELAIRSVPEGVQFSVRDSGIGIAQEQLDSIFEEFQQASNTGGRDPRAGSGLGLAISRQLLDLMKGQIWAESTVGEGSTFHFLLRAYTGTERSKGNTGQLTPQAETKSEGASA